MVSRSKWIKLFNMFGWYIQTEADPVNHDAKNLSQSIN